MNSTFVGREKEIREFKKKLELRNLTLENLAKTTATLDLELDPRPSTPKPLLPKN